MGSYAARLFAPTPTPHSLSAEQRKKILEVANKWNDLTNIRYQRGASTTKAIDCSHLVAKIYAEAGLPYSYTPSSGNWQSAGFKGIGLNEAQPGDLIVWGDHVGIIIDPQAKTFIAISSKAKSDPIQINSFANNTDWGQKSYRIMQMQNLNS